MSLFNPDLGHDLHPRAEIMSLGLVFLLVEHNLHRYALHYFDVVAGSVFGWQQAEARAAGAGGGIDMSLVGLAVRIHHDVYRQAGLDVFKLRLLEIRRDPEVRLIERNDLHHLLAGLHVLTGLDGAVADHSAY